MENKIIAVVGMAGSGKSTVVDILVKKYELPYVYFGNITLSEMEKRGLASGQENEKKIRTELRQLHGMSAYAKLSLPTIQELSLKNKYILIDGLYSWSEYTLLRKENIPLIVIAVVAKRKTRYKRLLERQTRPLSFEEAEKRDFAEIEGIEKGGPIAICDYYITNDGTPVELEIQVLKVASELGM